VKKKEKRRRWSIANGKEPIFVISGLVFAFLLLICLVLFLSYNIIRAENLNIQMQAERAFNSVYVTLSTMTGVSSYSSSAFDTYAISKATRVMQEEGVKAIGIYEDNGRFSFGLGPAPYSLSLEHLNILRNNNDDIQSGILTYNRETGMIEYLRFARQILLDIGTFSFSDNNLISNPVDFPNILYILFDGQAYQRRLTMVKAFSFFTIMAIGVFFLMIVNIYQSNKQYRETLAKQESLVNLGEAARTLTHEIKNPLSAITIQIALLKKMLPPEHKGDLQVVDLEVQRLIQLTNKVSDFLRNPLGTPEALDLPPFIETISQRFPMPVTFVPKSLVHVSIEFDADRARSVFENLLKNAMESCQGRDPQVEVEISLDKRELVHVYVRDRGDGVPEGDEKKIFDPFFTTKIHGSGIGLSISRQFVKARGGNIRLYPREGGGTVAEVVLPRSLHRVRDSLEG